MRKRRKGARTITAAVAALALVSTTTAALAIQTGNKARYQEHRVPHTWGLHVASFLDIGALREWGAHSAENPGRPFTFSRDSTLELKGPELRGALLTEAGRSSVARALRLQMVPVGAEQGAQPDLTTLRRLGERVTLHRVGPHVVARMSGLHGEEEPFGDGQGMLANECVILHDRDHVSVTDRLSTSSGGSPCNELAISMTTNIYRVLGERRLRDVPISDSLAVLVKELQTELVGPSGEWWRGGGDDLARGLSPVLNRLREVLVAAEMP